MKASELITNLSQAITEFGDAEIEFEKVDVTRRPVREKLEYDDIWTEDANQTHSAMTESEGVARHVLYLK